MIGSYGDTAWTVNEIYDYRTLAFDSIYKVISIIFILNDGRLHFMKGKEVQQIRGLG